MELVQGRSLAALLPVIFQFVSGVGGEHEFPGVWAHRESSRSGTKREGPSTRVMVEGLKLPRSRPQARGDGLFISMARSNIG
ncbi:MAG: hypothetical protein C5S43_00100 [Candidatus Methanocomedens sp.]|nr:MAG: hypothetical protein C5S43_00100 [ANME-2 cluster archaeon]